LKERDANRIESLDLIRGVAVLGILAVNIAGFAGPTLAVFSPHVPEPGSLADEIAFTTMLLVFEGKMRTLFSILFGASLLLFVERADARGQDGTVLQFRRLCWLALFGYLHFLLFWWGDILFLYAIAGMAALMLARLNTRVLLAIALLGFTAWQANGIARDLPLARIEFGQVTGATVTPAQAAEHEAASENQLRGAQRESGRYAEGFLTQAAYNLVRNTFNPVAGVVYSFGETLPLMLIGMVLLRTGFFTGGWSQAKLRKFSVAALCIGGSITAAFVGWAFVNHFPVQIMRLAINSALSFPHLLMALGYAGLLVLYAPQLLAGALGRRIAAAGRMALSNYLGTTILMTAIFYGWGFGLLGKVPDAWQPTFVLLGWAAMLSWSKPWLARFGQGPLEYVWRWLTKMRRTELI
jgi:uncharacterized protein